ncbi:MAG: recombination mediator RecR [Eubacteriales bacterium]|nr:recombination mediator RecR [Clostridiales bacterium]MDY5836525.1 recombination mediator RecR [Eubacteriales bacterium]
MSAYSPLIANLIQALGKLPGIGRKTAQRLAFHILDAPAEEAEALAQAILQAKKGIQLCAECCNFTENEVCEICGNPKRDRTTICVVESPRDLAAMERIHEYKGLYHVLHGVISPMQNQGPESLKLRELLSRLQNHPEVTEVILATNSSVEGEATALYVARLLKPSGIRCTRIAHGLPMGSDIEYADEVTLARALTGRTDL